MTSPAILSDPFQAGSGNGASSDDQSKSDRVELEGRGQDRGDATLGWCLRGEPVLPGASQ